MSNKEEIQAIENLEDCKPITNNEITMKPFAKSEGSTSCSYFTGGGINLSREDLGSLDLFVAEKVTNTASGNFIETKYATPGKYAAEFRTRFCFDETYKEGDSSIYMTQRVAAKGNWNLGKGFSIYEIAGANAKISLQGDGVQSVTPTSITGLGYKINKQISVYGEFEMAQAYKVPDKKWDDFKCGGYLGIKVTF